MLDPEGEHLVNRDPWLARMQTDLSLLRRIFPYFVPELFAKAKSGRVTKQGGGPSTVGREASREVPCYQACIFRSVAPVVRPGVDGSK